MAIKKVGVLGCGLMGSGIAQVAAQAGYETVVREVEQKFTASGGQFKELLVAVTLSEAFRYRPAIPGDM